MLRHGCGYALANAGHDTRAIQAWMGHKNIRHTVRYTELAPDRFNDFWRDELCGLPGAVADTLWFPHTCRSLTAGQTRVKLDTMDFDARRRDQEAKQEQEDDDRLEERFQVVRIEFA
jgi:hypothetical protein